MTIDFQKPLLLKQLTQAKPSFDSPVEFK